MPSLYSNCAILTTNCYLYTNSNGSTPVGAGFYSDGTTCWGTNTSGMITGSTTCPTPTPSATAAPSPTPSPTPTATDPATATLTIDYCNTNASSSTFSATLSAVIPSTNITVDLINLDGYSTSKCFASSVSDSNASLITVTKGTSQGTSAGASPFSVGTNPYRKFLNSVDVNGVTKSNGQTITVGATTVTISISTTCGIILTCGV